MATRLCVCRREITMDESIGPVASIAALKFYENASLYGHPTSRQKVFFCEECTPALIEFLKERQNYGPGPRGMVE